MVESRVEMLIDEQKKGIDLWKIYLQFHIASDSEEYFGKKF